MQTAFAVLLPTAIIAALAFIATNAYRTRRHFRRPANREETGQ